MTQAVSNVALAFGDDDADAGAMVRANTASMQCQTTHKTHVGFRSFSLLRYSRLCVRVLEHSCHSST